MLLGLLQSPLVLASFQFQKLELLLVMFQLAQKLQVLLPQLRLSLRDITSTWVCLCLTGVGALCLWNWC